MTYIQSIIPRLRHLVELAAQERNLRRDDPQLENIRRQIESLRSLLPTAVLVHHDRFLKCGKASVTSVRQGVCGGCHLPLHRVQLSDLRRSIDTVNVCDHCGVFIYLADEERPGVKAKQKTIQAKSTSRARIRRGSRLHQKQDS